MSGDMGASAFWKHQGLFRPEQGLLYLQTSLKGTTGMHVYFIMKAKPDPQ
jgi:hypothetical protein